MHMQHVQLNQKEIKDLVPGDAVTGYVTLLREVVPLLTRNKKEFIRLTFQDQSGQIEAKMWDTPHADVAKYPIGAVVTINGVVDEYNGKKEVTVQRVEILPQNHPAYNPMLFLQSAPMSVVDMKAYIQNYITNIERENPTIGALVRYVFDESETDGSADFYFQPAAKALHHAYVGGLAYHTLSLLALATNINLYPINRAVVYGAILLHDIGKTRELSNYVDTSYTTEGHLFGHIALADEMLTEARIKLGISRDDTWYQQLRHAMLSHHNKKEQGSPVEPKTLEAIFITHLDELDAKMSSAVEAVGRIEPTTFTERQFMFNNRQLYRP